MSLCCPRLSCLLLAAWFCLLSACTILPLSAPLPPGLELKALSPIAADSPLAWSGDGRNVAYVHAGVQVREVSSGAVTLLTVAKPVALAWTADATTLALALAEGEGTRLQLQQLPAGGKTSSTLLPGAPVALFWRNGEALVLTGELKGYSFGANLRTRVGRWDGSNVPRIETLHDVTLKPLTLNAWGQLLPALHADLAPWGDSMLYTRLHDPPEVSPYLKLIWRDLASGKERLLGDLNLASAGGRFIGLDDQIVVGEGLKNTRRSEVWSSRVLDVLPTAGKVLAVSPGGRSLLADDQLWHDGTLLLTLRGVSAASFSPRGDQLLLRIERTLYLLTGLTPDPLPPLPTGAELERQLLLRRWRALGLITPDEFNREKGRLP